MDILSELSARAEAFRWRISYGDDSFVGPWQLSQKESWAVLVGSVVLYYVVLGVSYVGRSALQPLLKLKDSHNLALAVYSFLTFAYTTWMMIEEKHFTSLQNMTCQPIEHPHFHLVAFLFLISKVWEWFDTVLLILKGSKLRFLHVIHHTTTFWLYAVDFTFNSSIKYGVAVNAFIHAVMYSHYYKPFPPAFRRLITQLQIVQFLISIFLHSMIFVYRCDKHLDSHFYEFVTPYILVISYLVLFLNFYISQYMFSSKKKEKSL